MFTQQFILQKYTQTQDEWGGTVYAWADYLTIKGRLWNLKGNEQLASDKETYFAHAKIATAIVEGLERGSALVTWGGATFTWSEEGLQPYITENFRIKDGYNLYEIENVAVRRRPSGTGHLELDLKLVR